MDDFFSKYGWVVAVGVIITIVITMMTPVGTTIQTSITGFVNNMATELGNLVKNIDLVP